MRAIFPGRAEHAVLLRYIYDVLVNVMLSIGVLYMHFMEMCHIALPQGRVKESRTLCNVLRFDDAFRAHSVQLYSMQTSVYCSSGFGGERVRNGTHTHRDIHRKKRR